jgi:hypothetical protein
MRAQSDGPAKGDDDSGLGSGSSSIRFFVPRVEINWGQKKRRPGTWRDGLEVKVYKK